MEKISRPARSSSRTGSKINTARELPVFSETQVNAFFSDYTESMDEALVILDEENKTRTGKPADFTDTQ